MKRKKLQKVTLPEELKEALRMAEECDKVRDYFKMKYDDEELSEYEFSLISGIFFYVKSLNIQDVNEDETSFLKIMFECYGLKLPGNIPSFNVLLGEIIGHQWIKIQDSTGKYLYGPYIEMKDYRPSFKITRCQRSFNCSIEKLKHSLTDNQVNAEIAEAGDWLYDAFKGMDFYTAQCLIKWIEHKEGHQTKEKRLRCLPNDTIIGNTEKWWELIYAYTHIGTTDETIVPGQDKSLYCESIFVVVEALKEMGAFVALCSFFISASFHSENYRIPLLNLACYIIGRFRNSYVYQIEFPASDAHLDIPVNDRKSDDHTTRMKIYLLDKGSIPTVIRIDFPHAGEEFLHLNIKTINGTDKDDHLQIDIQDGKYEGVLGLVQEAMQRECPLLFNVKDSTKEDDDKVLSDMYLFKHFFCLCMDYLEGKKDSTHFDKLKELMSKEYDDCKDAIFDGRVYFQDKIGL